MIAETDSDHDHTTVERRIRDLLAAVDCCAMATVDRTADPPTPHVCTLYYAVDDADPRVLYVLTPPETAHGRHLADGSGVALAVYDSHQRWADAKRGLQLFGSARGVDATESERAFDAYVDRFPGLTDLIDDPSGVTTLDSRFYRVGLDRAKLFDEPAFGTETWVDARLEPPAHDTDETGETGADAEP